MAAFIQVTSVQRNSYWLQRIDLVQECCVILVERRIRFVQRQRNFGFATHRHRLHGFEESAVLAEFAGQTKKKKSVVKRSYPTVLCCCAFLDVRCAVVSLAKPPQTQLQALKFFFVSSIVPQVNYRLQVLLTLLGPELFFFLILAHLYIKCEYYRNQIRQNYERNCILKRKKTESIYHV